MSEDKNKDWEALVYPFQIDEFVFHSSLLDHPVLKVYQRNMDRKSVVSKFGLFRPYLVKLFFWRIETKIYEGYIHTHSLFFNNSFYGQSMLTAVVFYISFLEGKKEKNTTVQGKEMGKHF